jgi:uncharacterized protein
LILLDTTVLVYAVGDSHPLRDPCRKLVTAVTDGGVVATTTPEVIQEFVHVRARRRSRADAAGLGRDWAELLSPLVEVTQNDLDRGLQLFERHPDLGCFDAVLVAVALDRGATALVSADTAFSTVSTLRHVDPGSSGLDRLIDQP